MTGHIGWTHRHAYSNGIDPIEHAVEHVAMFVNALTLIRASRAIDPSTFPTYGPDISDEHFARRIIGGLMEAGWTPPDVTP